MSGFEKGLTLLEVLLGVTILSTGLIIVFQPLLTSINALRYASNRVEAVQYLSNQAWELQSRAWTTHSMPASEHLRLSLGDDREFQYTMNSRSLSPDNNLYLANLNLLWKQAGLVKKVNKMVYVTVPKTSA